MRRPVAVRPGEERLDQLARSSSPAMSRSAAARQVVAVEQRLLAEVRLDPGVEPGAERAAGDGTRHRPGEVTGQPVRVLAASRRTVEADSDGGQGDVDLRGGRRPRLVEQRGSSSTVPLPHDGLLVEHQPVGGLRRAGDRPAVPPASALDQVRRPPPPRRRRRSGSRRPGAPAVVCGRRGLRSSSGRGATSDDLAAEPGSARGSSAGRPTAHVALVCCGPHQWHDATSSCLARVTAT